MMGNVKIEAFPFYIACREGHIALLDWMLSHDLPLSEMTRTGKWYEIKDDINAECLVGIRCTMGTVDNSGV